MGQTNQDAVFWQTEGAMSLLIVADGISVSTAGSGNLASAILVQVIAIDGKRKSNGWQKPANQKSTLWTKLWRKPIKPSARVPYEWRVET